MISKSGACFVEGQRSIEMVTKDTGIDTKNSERCYPNPIYILVNGI